MLIDGSYIKSVIDKVRFYTDEPATDAKYDNNWLTSQLLMPAQAEVINRIHQTSRGRILLKLTITFEEEVTRYALPPTVHQVVRLVRVNSSGDVVTDFRPRDLLHPSGPGWRIEGPPGYQTLVIDKTPTQIESVQLWYVPGAEFNPVYSTSNASVSAANTDTTSVGIVKHSTTYGFFDRRENAYAGQMFRWLPSSTDATAKNYPVVTSLIESNVYYNSGAAAAAYITLVDAINVPATTAGYEIIPPFGPMISEAVALSMAMKIATARSKSGRFLEDLRRQYMMACKAAGDQMTYLQTRKPDSFETNTLDNEAMGWGIYYLE